MPRPPPIAFKPPRSPRVSTIRRRDVDATIGLLIHLLTVTIILVGVLLAQAAAQEPAMAMRDACLADYQRLCSSVAPGGGRIKQCMLDHADELTPDCRSALLSQQGAQ